MAERTPLYLDFENGAITEFGASDTMPEGNQFVLPAGYVVARNTNTNPSTDLGYGSWTLLGSQLIGATTVYYFERDAP